MLPWVLLILYDFFVYTFRVTTYEIPYIGGKARNRPRPRAPSLSERPDGQPRELRIPAVTTSADLGGSAIDDGAESVQKIDEKIHLSHRVNADKAINRTPREQLQL